MATAEETHSVKQRENMADEGGALAEACPTKPEKPYSARIRRTLSFHQQEERAELVRRMIKEGKRNVDIYRACHELYGNKMNQAIIHALRGEHKKQPTKTKPGPKVEKPDELSRAFKHCLGLMRLHGVARVNLDGEKELAVVETKTTRTINLSA